MFFDKYYELCVKMGVAPSKVATDNGISKTSVTRWKNGAAPSSDIVKKLADYFGVSVDYLLSRETATSKRLKELVRETGLSENALSRLCTISESDLLDYESGKKTPTEHELSMLSELFDVSVDYLKGDSEYKTHYDEGTLEPLDSLAYGLSFEDTCQKLKDCLSLYEVYYYSEICDSVDLKAALIESIICDHIAKVIEAYKEFADTLIEDKKKDTEAITSLYANLSSNEIVGSFIDMIYDDKGKEDKID